MQEVAESLAADAAKLAADEPAKNEHAKAEADPDKLERRILLPALFVARDESKPQPDTAAAPKAWRKKTRDYFEQFVWAQKAAAAFLTLAVAGGAYLGLMDYLDRSQCCDRGERAPARDHASCGDVAGWSRLFRYGVALVHGQLSGLSVRACDRSDERGQAAQLRLVRATECRGSNLGSIEVARPARRRTSARMRARSSRVSKGLTR